WYKPRARSPMNRSLLVIGVFLAGSLATFALPTLKAVALKAVDDAKYKPGQVWSYKTRIGEETSTLTILLVEETPKGKRIVHIHVDGIQLKNCKGGNAPQVVDHMPFAKESLDASVVAVVGNSPVPAYKDGYSEWRQGWDEGKAGFYTMTVSAAIDVMQSTFRKGIGCP